MHRINEFDQHCIMGDRLGDGEIGFLAADCPVCALATLRERCERYEKALQHVVENCNRCDGTGKVYWPHLVESGPQPCFCCSPARAAMEGK